MLFPPNTHTQTSGSSSGIDPNRNQHRLSFQLEMARPAVVQPPQADARTNSGCIHQETYSEQPEGWAAPQARADESPGKQHATACFRCMDSLSPVDCVPPGSSVHWNSPDKNTGVGCCPLLQGSSRPGLNLPLNISCLGRGVLITRTIGNLAEHSNQSPKVPNLLISSFLFSH